MAKAKPKLAVYVQIWKAKIMAKPGGKWTLFGNLQQARDEAARAGYSGIKVEFGSPPK